MSSVYRGNLLAQLSQVPDPRGRQERLVQQTNPQRNVSFTATRGVAELVRSGLAAR